MKRLELVCLVCTLWCMLDCGGGGGTPPPPPPPSLAITSAALPSGAEGSVYGSSGFALAASGGAAPYNWNWAPAPGSSLPNGLTLSPDGLISGTPTLAGTYNVVVTVADSESPPAQVSASYTLSIDGAAHLTITSGAPPSGTVGTDYGPSVTEYLSCIWSPVLGWHQVCTRCARPQECLSLPRCTGAMNIKPCLRTVEIFVGFSFTATGGTEPYQWSAEGLPPGLSIDANTGEVKGTPTTVGSFRVTVTVSDSATPIAQVTASYDIDIVNAMSVQVRTEAGPSLSNCETLIKQPFSFETKERNEFWRSL